MNMQTYAFIITKKDISSMVRNNYGLQMIFVLTYVAYLDADRIDNFIFACFSYAENKSTQR